MIIKWLKSYRRNFLREKKLKKNRFWVFQEEYRLMEIYKPEELSDSEIKAIIDLWGPLGLSKELANEFRIFKKFNEFDPNYLSNLLYYPIIITALNPSSYYSVYENKGLYDLIFKGLKMPRTIIKNIEGQFFDETSTLLSKQNAKRKIKDEESFFFKPTVDTFGGKGVKVYHKTDLTEENVNEIIDNFPKNYILQEIIIQHEDTEIFNKTSVNTIRVTSLYLNGKTTILFILLMIGGRDQIADNSTESLRVRVDEDGNLDAVGYDKYLKKHIKSNNGTLFKGKRITHISKCIEMALNNHSRYFPGCGVVGWDIAIDQGGNAVFIEGNSRVPGIRTGQICWGPLFGERTNEVIEHVKINPAKL